MTGGILLERISKGKAASEITILKRGGSAKCKTGLEQGPRCNKNKPLTIQESRTLQLRTGSK